MEKWISKGYVSDSDEDALSQSSDKSERDTDLLPPINSSFHNDPRRNQTDARPRSHPEEPHQDTVGKTNLDVADQRNGEVNVDQGMRSSLRDSERRQGDRDDRQAGKGSIYNANLKSNNDEHVLPQSPNSSNASSPLSEAPSFLPEFPTILRSDHGSADGSDTSSEDLSDVSAVLADLGAKQRSVVDYELVAGQRTSKSMRSFRSRKPVQLHPYLVEMAKYNTLRRAHGLKPIHRRQSETLQPNEAPQDLDSFADENPMSAFETPINADDPSSQMFLSPHVDSDEELPEVSALLSFSSPRLVRRRPKRRKLNLYSSKKESARLQDHSIESSDPPPTPDLGQDSIFDIPPSPPRSGSLTPFRLDSRVKPQFRVPGQKLTRANLPTPITSSEPGKYPPHQKSLLDISSDSDSSGTDNSNSPDQTQLSDEGVIQHQLQKAERRIRGVLPASWLKLDLKAQGENKKDTPRRLSDSPSNGEPLRGIAQRKSRTTNVAYSKQPHFEDAFILSDDESFRSDISDRETRGEEAQVFRSNRPYQEFEHLNVHQNEEALEDDTVDAMLPSLTGSRRNRAAQQRSNRLKKPTQPVQQGAVGLSNRRIGGSLHQPRITTKFDQIKRKSRHPASSLGILDARGSHSAGSGTTPAFIKIASRTARSRHDKGRSRPARKIFQFTAEDDRDVQEILSAWEAGATTSEPLGSIITNSDRHPLKSLPINASVTPSTQKRWDLPKELEPAAEHADTRPKAAARSVGKTPARPGEVMQGLLRKPSDRTTARFTARYVPSVDKNRRKPFSTTLTSSHITRSAMLEDVEMPLSYLQKRLRSGFEAISNEAHSASLQKFQSVQSSTRLPSPNDLFMKPVGVGDSALHSAANKIMGLQSKPQRQPRTSIKRRKRLPKQFDQARDQPSAVRLDIDISDLESPEDECPSTRPSSLLGIGQFGNQYSNTFDVVPLPSGVCFHRNTLLGSGDFRTFLQPNTIIEQNTSGNFASIVFKGRNLRWSAWNEAVAADIEDCFDHLAANVSGLFKPNIRGNDPVITDMISLQKDILSFLTHHIRFLDQIDRLNFVRKCKIILQNFLQEMIHHNSITETANGSARMQNSSLKVLVLSVLIANKLRQISEHSAVPFQLQDEIRNAWLSWIRVIWEEIKKDMTAFETCLWRLKQNANVEYILNEQDQTIEAFISIYHVLKTAGLKAKHMWEILSVDAFRYEAGETVDIAKIEHIWRQIFNLLPFLEVDDQGVLEVGARFKVAADNWSLVKELTHPILYVYLSDPRNQAPTFNMYCRAVFGRCLHLINAWGWHRCEPIIGTLFDFFAKNNLAHLRNEADLGSPNFLMHLDSDQTLHARPEDRCFHLLLKMIGSGIKHMRGIFSDKKIRDFAWRLMPNHGRSHPKDQPIRQQDLDALRNHHDLLCTIYWASPPGFRPALSAIRNLVDFENSHREACRIAVSAWRNLAVFQVSTHESTEVLYGFRQWHSEFLTQMLRQHALARTEAEDQFKHHALAGEQLVSQSMLEDTISSNQRYTEEVLNDSLFSLQAVINSSRTRNAAAALMSPQIGEVFGLFDGLKTQAHSVIMIALDTILNLERKIDESPSKCAPQDDNDDSQEYGDWSAFNSDLSQLEPDQSPTELSPIIALHDPLKNLLSNCFGADDAPKDAFLSKTVDTWVAVGRLSVKEGFKTWDDYIDRFGKESWISLRQTHQTRKYTAYFLASVITTDVTVYSSHRINIFTTWAYSLVERESLLKWQHILTNALLNANEHDELLTNLPFSKNVSKNCYDITAEELSDRRLSLVSSLISNIRLALRSKDSNPNRSKVVLQQEYKGILKGLMYAMRQNYEELGQGSALSGDYVEFVHHVIQNLQEHTSSIIPVDRFFTDNVTFPLPSSDPAYVVGRLRNYGLHLQEQGTPKQLAIFLQSLLERSVLDGQQGNFSEQLHSVLSDVREGLGSKSNMRKFVIDVVLPTYLRAAFQYPCGWVLATPLLDALEKSFGELYVDLNGFDPGSIRDCESLIQSFLQCLSDELIARAAQGDLCISTPVLKTLAACYEAVISIFSTLSHVAGFKQLDRSTVSHLCFLYAIADDALSFEGQLSFAIAARLQVDRGPTHVNPQWKDVRQFTLHQLQETLSRNWTYEANNVFFMKGTTKQIVGLDVSHLSQAIQELRVVLKHYQTALEIHPGLRCVVGENVPFRRRKTAKCCDLIL